MVSVADQDQLARRAYRRDDGSRQLRVQHAGFIDNDHVVSKRDVPPMVEAFGTRPEESMNGARLATNDLAQALGCLSGRSGQCDRTAEGFETPDQDAHRCGLAHAGATRQHEAAT